MAKKRKGRLLDGVLLLDKPLGQSSNDALQKIRRLYGAAKAGHTGSLDPLATGVLPVCFGEATKFSQYLLDADKVYVTTAKLGVVTATSDSEGAIIATHPVPGLSDAAIESVLDDFRGASLQTPSMFSALKHNGRPLYEFARKGIEVERDARAIHVSLLEVLDRTADTLTMKVHCSKGTYIRNLVEDIGEKLGCGAHVAALRRIAAGPFAIDDCHSLDELVSRAADLEGLEACLLPADVMLMEFQKIMLDSELGRSLLHGQPVRIGAGFVPGLARIYIDGAFVGVGEYAPDGSLAPKRLCALG